MESKNKEKWFYFTFGVGHPFSKTCMKVWGTSESSRELMFEHFGNKWAFQYEDEEVANRWGYEIKEIK